MFNELKHFQKNQFWNWNFEEINRNSYHLVLNEERFPSIEWLVIALLLKIISILLNENEWFWNPIFRRFVFSFILLFETHERWSKWRGICTLYCHVQEANRRTWNFESHNFWRLAGKKSFSCILFAYFRAKLYVFCGTDQNRVSYLSDVDRHGCETVTDLRCITIIDKIFKIFLSFITAEEFCTRSIESDLYVSHSKLLNNVRRLCLKSVYPQFLSTKCRCLSFEEARHNKRWIENICETSRKDQK